MRRLANASERGVIEPIQQVCAPLNDSTVDLAYVRLSGYNLRIFRISMQPWPPVYVTGPSAGKNMHSRPSEIPHNMYYLSTYAISVVRSLGPL